MEERVQEEALDLFAAADTVLPRLIATTSADLATDARDGD